MPARKYMLGWMLATAVGVAAGCRVDQQAEVALYRAMLDIGEPVVVEAGQPLTLRDALLLANQGNEALPIQGEQFLRALIARQRAVAAFLPTVDLVGTFSFRDDTDTNGVAGGAVTGGAVTTGARRTTFDLSAVGRINLFNGLSDLYALRRDARLIEQQRELLLDAQEALLVDVAEAYYAVLAAEAASRVLEGSLAVQERRLEDLRQRLEAGLSTPLEVSQAEAQLTGARLQLVEARRAAQAGRLVLGFVTAAPVLDSPLTDGQILPASLDAPGAFAATALVSRRDLRAADGLVDATRADVEVAFGQYYPRVDLNLTYFLSRQSRPEDLDWLGFIEARLPIFDGGRIRADVRSAWSRFREAVLTRGQLQRAVVREARETWLELETSEVRLGQLLERLDVTERAYAQAEQLFIVGLASNIERIRAVDDLLAVQLDLAQEQFDRKRAYVRLLRATGRLRDALAAEGEFDPVVRAEPPERAPPQQGGRLPLRGSVADVIEQRAFRLPEPPPLPAQPQP